MNVNNENLPFFIFCVISKEISLWEYDDRPCFFLV